MIYKSAVDESPYVDDDDDCYGEDPMAAHVASSRSASAHVASSRSASAHVASSRSASGRSIRW